jgi:hypothetical protein
MTSKESICFSQVTYVVKDWSSVTEVSHNLRISSLEIEMYGSCISVRLNALAEPLSHRLSPRHKNVRGPHPSLLNAKSLISSKT